MIKKFIGWFEQQMSAPQAEAKHSCWLGQCMPQNTLICVFDRVDQEHQQ